MNFPATDKQRAFIRSLCAEREHPFGDNVEQVIAALDKAAASRTITGLLAAPRKAKAVVTVACPRPVGQWRFKERFDGSQPLAADVAELVNSGRYALHLPGEIKLRFFELRAAKGNSRWWAGAVFFYELFGAAPQVRCEPINGSAASAIVRHIAASGPFEAQQRYGTELGHCGRCGADLTDRESRMRGIGPDCWEIGGFKARASAALVV